MVWYAEQDNLLRPDRGISGTLRRQSPICVPTLSGFFIGDIMVEIPLTKDKFAIVDDDLWWLGVWKWHASKSGRSCYAVHHERDKKTGKSIRFRMHRIIINAGPLQIVDHINGNGLDNRRVNLRFCTQSQNFQNGRKRKGCTSIYKGVSFHSKANKWRAMICKPGTGRVGHIGLFLDEKDAAKAYDKKAIKLFGEFARPNFPQSYQHCELLPVK